MRITPKLARLFVAPPKSEQALEQETCFSLRLFSQATELARCGFYEDAETLIRQALVNSTALRPALWDLLAKVYAQQGRYFDAEASWREALKLSPGSLPSLEGLRAIARERQASPFDKLLKWILVIFAISLYSAWRLTAIP